MQPAYTLAAAFLLGPVTLAAQQPSQSPASAASPHHEANFETERAHANELYLAQKRLVALPLYEDLCRQDPTVAVFAERHAGGLLAKLATVTDPKQQQEIMGQAIKELVRAQSLGDNSPYVQQMLGATSKTPLGLAIAGPLGGLPLSASYNHHPAPAAVAPFQQAETVFARNELQSAIKLYLAAASADPAWYEAALYTGDCYFRMKDNANAGIWYAKATAIDPDRETAFRYWADMLTRAGDTAGGRLRSEQAIVAEPYNSATWGGLQQWSLVTQTSLAQVKIVRPDFTAPNGKLTIDPALSTESGDGVSSWIAYQQARVQHGAPSASQLIMSGGSNADSTFTPNGYVHTLGEEMDALHALLLDIHAKLASGAVTQARLDPSLKTLVQLEKDDMLEPFVLVSLNDAGLRHGYPAYRAGHRDQIAAYIDRYLIGGPTPPNTPSPYVPMKP